MNNAENWDHAWFGVWKETGPVFKKCPSIHEFIDEKVTDYRDKDKILEYLEKAQVVATTSRLSFPCVLTKSLSENSNHLSFSLNLVGLLGHELEKK